MLPEGTSDFRLPAKRFLTSFRVCEDVKRAIRDFPNQPTIGIWHVQWAGICALLKSSIVVMRLDAKRCFSQQLRAALTEGFHRLGRDKGAYPLMWEFINKERNNILKEYAFSAYDTYIREDGTVVEFASLFDLGTSRHELRIRNGAYAGRLALEVASEAAEWVEEYLLTVLQEGGYDPDTAVSWREFLK